ncbi:MAG: ATP-binding protein [Roseburia sp.]|nr:ATP-binding protein [Roseburia sp.]
MAERGIQHMAKALPIGIEFYKEMIEKQFYYVDKTLMIKDILDSGAKVSLFTRPRRFGKTLALTMLQTFFEDERDREGKPVDNSLYFAGKKIESAGETYMEKMGQYPVINLTLKSAKQPTYEMAYSVLRDEIREEFRRHKYVCGSDCLDEDEKKKFLQMIEGKAEAGEYATSLAFLSVCLKKYHGKNVVILIDEYDVPLENAYFERFYDSMIKFVRSLFESALKTNICLELAVITGCLRISRESIFTGLNNLKVISILRDDAAECFGFTPEEVEEMLKAYGKGSRTEEVRDWYDGYLFGDTEVYNPWSVINYVDENKNKKNILPKPYWSNTSSNSIVRELIEEADFDTRGEIENLLAGGTIEKQIHEDITYGDIHESQDNLWNFLFFTGYLKKVGERFESDNIYLTMTIPNREIRYVYQNSIFTWFDKKVKTSDRKPLYEALLSGDCSAIEKILKKQLIESISFYDGGEQFYHGFMVGMLGGLGTYHLKSNREAGDGRADLIMEPLDENDPVVILELKTAEKFSLMEERCEAALRQIEEKHYDAWYKEMGYEHYVKYGISFCKKSLKVKSELN